jgi:ketosteroid isomerase-like protein
VSANLDLVRSIYADWERGDYGKAEWAHPKIEFVLADGPDPSRSKGLAGMAEAMRGMLRLWEDFRVEAEEYREFDDGRVLVLDHLSGRGKTSGLDLGRTRTTGVWLFHIRDGSVTKMVRYLDRDHALADLGLEDG